MEQIPSQPLTTEPRSLEAPEHVPPLPAAVEVATLRIAQEALTNVVRHSHASRCSVRLELHEPKHLLELEIEDNGCGLGSALSHGVGLGSMRERAEELGGTWKVVPGPEGGTCVQVRLPTLLPQLAEALAREARRTGQGEQTL